VVVSSSLPHKENRVLKRQLRMQQKARMMNLKKKLRRSLRSRKKNWNREFENLKPVVDIRNKVREN
jgi:hypothetical protein